ncbi:MAG: hypothetical protein EB000_02250 [Alphaproteobacteria bacterium]|jgi:hypothetical protein|nr:hypothetical protein [Alphaproteobacteria bacterium]
MYQVVIPHITSNNKRFWIIIVIRSLLISSSINPINRIIVKNINTIDNIINRGVGRNEKIESTKTSNNIPPRVSVYDSGS